ncbi:hypothetical protein [Pseudoalteromonas luteoviolacea]|uniref:Uncharacterized protein n=1 Tax=Pseudoalteromonas luteoviolacea H33 TaxID=1365251 RepID=A0A161Y3N9_9GAMM|nr:hypothetical protein [Pseudoalteromonas luteoviolacea]KZN49801.1 hypothetical protein N476_18585 [Pseudoalteromonas luteoviolacea H33]KZN77825.1 hypothetical protein N477_01040 [Pseudoalteromonas luteoviolacea H33-S]MBQ4879468.1 hypothetical protein [Pseudoalteromonas luteoviolacea]MBQ4908528.1 hypothetical protein [Pseudoalteromonas luteoviolacea]
MKAMKLQKTVLKNFNNNNVLNLKMTKEIVGAGGGHSGNGDVTRNCTVKWR